MTIGVLQLDLRMPEARSLKDRRRVVKSLKDQLRNRFNCSVTELDPKDKWGRARIAACVIGDDSRFVNTQLDQIARFAASRPGAELLDYQIELL